MIIAWWKVKKSQNWSQFRRKHVDAKIHHSFHHIQFYHNPSNSRQDILLKKKMLQGQMSGEDQSL